MTEEENKFYRDLYKIFSDEKINSLIVQYAKLEYNKELKKLRSKQELFDYAYNNGSLDAWQHIISLKDKLTTVMRNIS